MTFYEARYFLDNGEFSCCLGCVGGSTNFTVEQILANQADQLIKQLVDRLDEFLGFNSHIKLENDAKVSVFNEPGADNSVNINFWISKNEPDKAQLHAIKIESQSWSYRPKISIITPVYNTERYVLTQ